jgi:predicted adenine nucleotide alpha hydrolase (AANH) superfamily ATPase
MANLLLHTCCGPCATNTVEEWRGERLEVATLWYNPNIHPQAEHIKRREAMQGLARALELPLDIREGEVTDYFRVVGRDRADRCAHCFSLRLGETARAAREGGFDAFSTTLLISPYQKHELLRGVAEEASRRHKVRFLYRDLRPGYQRSRQLIRHHGLYRQSYCGCVYSLQERLSGLQVRDEGTVVVARKIALQ